MSQTQKENPHVFNYDKGMSNFTAIFLMFLIFHRWQYKFEDERKKPHIHRMWCGSAFDGVQKLPKIFTNARSQAKTD